MTNNFKLLLNFIVFTIVIFTIGTASAGSSFKPPCNLDANGAITDTVACATTPDIQRVTFYKAGLCLSQPQFLGNGQLDLSSCQNFFNNPNGQSIDINQNVVANLNGTLPTNGTYSYYYVEIDPNIGIQALRTFSTDRTGSAGGTGPACWSITGQFFSSQNSSATTVNCGNLSQAVPNVSTVHVNEAVGSNQVTFTASNNATLYIALLNSSGTLATINADPSVDNRISKIVVYSSQNVTITDSTSTLLINYKNSEGAGIQMGTISASPAVLSYFTGPFDLYITSQ